MSKDIARWVDEDFGTDYQRQSDAFRQPDYTGVYNSGAALSAGFVEAKSSAAWPGSESNFQGGSGVNVVAATTGTRQRVFAWLDDVLGSGQHGQARLLTPGTVIHDVPCESGVSHGDRLMMSASTAGRVDTLTDAAAALAATRELDAIALTDADSNTCVILFV